MLLLVSKWETSDYALLKIAERIPVEYNAYFAGWDATMRAPADVVWYSSPLRRRQEDFILLDKQFLALGLLWDRIKMRWKIPRWNEGATERGSSGSALFNTLGQVVRSFTRWFCIVHLSLTAGTCTVVYLLIFIILPRMSV